MPKKVASGFVFDEATDSPEHYGLQVVGETVQLLPLRSCCVKAQLSGYVVGLDSTLKYVNDRDAPVEVLFKFPVDQSYAVVGMEAVIDGRKIKAEIKKKEEAKRDYHKALASGHAAALAEEKSGDIFSIALGNLPTKAEAEVRLKMVGELPIDAEGRVRFSLPAVLKPRYTPQGSVDPLACKSGAVHGQAPAVYDFVMSVKKEGVADVTSPTHIIQVDKKDENIKVCLSGKDDHPLTKDLVILVSHSAPHVPKVLYELGNRACDQSSYMGAPAVMVSFFPKFEDIRAVCEFIFLVDRSGSMCGSYIERARETLVLFLKSTPLGCNFNIIGFGSTYESLFQESVPNDQMNLDYAMKYAESLQADLGGTELLSPLKHILEQPTLPGKPRQIFVLTDGSVSNTESCTSEVSRNAHKCRVFTFGIGSGASTALVNGLAKAGNGTAEFIKEGEKLQPKVICSLKRALQPSVSDLQLNVDLPSGFKVFQAPANIPAVFNGEKLVIYAILKSKATSESPPLSGLSGTVTLKGQISEEPITHSMPFDSPAPPIMGEDELESSTGFDIPVIHQLAAKSLLNDWSAGKGWGSTALALERVEESVNLSLESNVISEHTAFVAIDTEHKQLIENAIGCYDITASTEESYIYSAPHIQPMSRNPLFSELSGARYCSQKTRYASSYSHVIRSSAACPKMMGELDSDHDNEAKPLARVAKTLTALIIALQCATGNWSLGDLCIKVFHKNEAEMKCPSDVSKDVWATILALVFLEKKFADMEDEWEMVAAKAEAWLSNQSLPQGVSIASLKENAKTII